MKLDFSSIGYVLCSVCMTILFACSDTELEHGEEGWVGDRPVEVVLPFGQDDFETVKVSTRSTQNIVPESRIYNMYVYLFVGGRKVYSHFFDASNKVPDITSEQPDCWQITNMTVDGGKTTGILKMRVPSVSGATLYVLANLEANLMDMSKEKLGFISEEAELENLFIHLNQTVISRNGYFPMKAKVGGININTEGKITSSTKGLPAVLKRMDAKIKVNVRVATDNEITEPSAQKLRSFEPMSWQVINVPKHVRYFSKISTPTEFFDSEPVRFESMTDVTVQGQTTSLHSFSFYMLENMPAKKKDFPKNEYPYREMRCKNADGSYKTEGDKWEYAPETATYLVIKGNVNLVIDENSPKPQPIIAEATYYVHLGNFGKKTDGTRNFSDFNVRANTIYTYDILIKGINRIQVEVKEGREEQPGAAGDVFTARELISDFDSHYGQRVFRFFADYIEPDKVTWYVKTPFGRVGTPLKVGDTEVASGLDYEWVHIMINPLDASGKTYSHALQPYPKDKSQMMSILEFTRYMKEQKRKLDESRPHAFKPDKDGKMCIYATFFVDEFYYDKDPINGNTEDLWKKFVNQPPRMMHILCDNKISADGESSETGSVVTIRQQSIQTPYTLLKPELTSAWGVDSREDSFKNMSLSVDAWTGSGADQVKYDGMENTIQSGMLPINGKWSDYLDYSADTLSLKQNKRCLRYLPLLCNRDENGDDIIDLNEIKWYVGSEDQLIDLFMGDQGISPEAQLYPVSMSKNHGQYNSGPYQGADRWRLHVLSSTFKSNSLQMVWAEEGVSTGSMSSDDVDGMRSAKIIRCMRNLGAGTPERLIRYIPNPETGIFGRFDLSNINTKSLRAYTSKELEPDDERSDAARLCKGFDVGEIQAFAKPGNVQNPAYGTMYEVLKELLVSDNSPCSQGWRVPNVREGALMSLYCNHFGGKRTLVSTYYSLGPLGLDIDKSVSAGNQRKISWAFGTKYASLFIDGESSNICLVRDWLP